MTNNQIADTVNSSNRDKLLGLVDRVQFLLHDYHPGLSVWRDSFQLALQRLHDEMKTYEWLR